MSGPHHLQAPIRSREVKRVVTPTRFQVYAVHLARLRYQDLHTLPGLAS